ncbi:pantetheine-phosphate adenylyltransferase, partial [Chryseobacterium gambrini]|nr:pantetheine-phosphate adenylyltransferase [Chryseobacterium gambrini]
IGFSGLLADVIKQHNIKAIIRGVRAVADFEYELQLSHLNRLLTNGVESLFFPPSDRWSYVSSTMIREISLHGGDTQALVPQVVYQALN